MLKQRKAFIWDLDGTLLDSYEIIVSSLQKTYQEYGIQTDKENVHRHVIRYSVSSLYSVWRRKPASRLRL